MDNKVITKTGQWVLSHHRSVALIVLLTSVFVSLSWQYGIFIETLNSIKTVNADRTIDKINSSEQYNPIDFLSLFGTASETDNKSFIPKTSLNLKLKGILHSNNNGLSSAIILGPGGSERLYKIGDKLPGGATLESIYDRYVIIQYQEEKQKVVFPEGKQKSFLHQTSKLPTTKNRNSAKQQEDARQLENRLNTLRNKLGSSGK